MPRKPTQRPLTCSVAFTIFDKLGEAHNELGGTLGILTQLVDNNCVDDIDVIVTMERHLKADVANLGAVITKVREAILDPLYARRAYDAPEPEEVPAGASASVALVVDNDGGDHAA